MYCHGDGVLTQQRKGTNKYSRYTAVGNFNCMIGVCRQSIFLSKDFQDQYNTLLQSWSCHTPIYLMKTGLTKTTIMSAVAQLGPGPWDMFIFGWNNKGKFLTMHKEDLDSDIWELQHVTPCLQTQHPATPELSRKTFSLQWALLNWPGSCWFVLFLFSKL